MAFIEVEFPTTLSYHAVGGPEFSTMINQGFGGQEQRNRNWALARGKWSVSLMTPASFPGTRQHFIDLLLGFFLVAGGKFNSFRLKDHKDFQATAEPLITVPGGVSCAKTYTFGGVTYQRPITKIITSAVKDYQGNSLADTYSGPGTVDPNTGLVSGGTAGQTASFQFHHPVRFDSDELAMQIEAAAQAGGPGPVVAWNSIQLVEVLPPNY